MQFLTDMLTGVLSLYLAFTNILADEIQTFLPQEEGAIRTVSIDTSSDASGMETLAELESNFETGDTLPDILIENASYQGATAIANDFTTEATTDPLEAVVNIYCVYETKDYTRRQSGSGFFVSPEGVILTNAHVAQFLLLENVEEAGETSCIVRGGNPPEPLYEAELLYISPAWIQEHAHLINDPNPKGTGERDYALLYVTRGLNNNPLPGTFPYLSVDTALLPKSQIGETVTIAGFPGGDLFSENESGPVPQKASAKITDMFTFGSNYADIFSIGSSSVGMHGISGGPVLNDSGEVIGLVSTKGSTEEGTYTLRALTLSYIDRTMLADSTFDLASTATGALELRARLFMETIVPFLARIVESEL